MVKELMITPPAPKPGDPIAVTVRGDCGQVVPIELHYEQTIPLRGDSFSMQMHNIQVPWHRNTLTIEASNVSTLNVAAKFLLWINKKVNVINGSGQYTLTNVPKGNYTVKVEGTAPRGTQNVTVRVDAHSELQLDGQGCCVYTLQSNPENSGRVAVKCHDIEKRVEIKR